jgi:hypothetical protein
MDKWSSLMKCLVTRVSALLIAVPVIAMANWQVADTTSSPTSRFKSGIQTQPGVSPTVASIREEPRRPVAIPAEPFFQTGVSQHIQSYGGTIPDGAIVETSNVMWKETSESSAMQTEPSFAASGRQPLPYPSSHGATVSNAPSTWGYAPMTPPQSGLQNYADHQHDMIVGPHLGRHETVALVSNYNRYMAPIPSVYAISVSGSLKENLIRIMNRYHWKVIWKAPYDYNFDGRVTGSSLPNVVEKLLRPFPLQAVMYMSNHTMTVVSRTL